MAKIEFVHEETEYVPKSTETVEVRVWGLGGAENQEFDIGSGANFQANGNIWLEMLQSVEGAQIFYTRTFLHHGWGWDEDIKAGMEKRLDELLKKGEGSFGFGDMLPESFIELKLQKEAHPRCDLEISADTGAVFGFFGPGSRAINIHLNLDDPAVGAAFMRELIQEIDAAYQGKHPNPCDYPDGSSEWPFVWQLNRRAYNQIAETYRESYFENPLLAAAFEGWTALLPPGGPVLDMGCGHGDPVIARLLEKGFQVTGSDFTPRMLEMARQRFPQAAFVERASTQIDFQSAFDGVCSFSSILYLDPIDFLNSVWRAHSALRPGGLLFLYAYDSGPGWRGAPLRHVMDQWMWAWHYGVEEVAQLLEEHGYFEVLDMQKVKVDPDEAERIAKEQAEMERQLAEYREKREKSGILGGMPFPVFPPMASPYAYAIVARRREAR